MTARRIVYLAALGAALVFYLSYREWFSWFLLLLIVLLPWFSLLLSLYAMLSFRARPVGPGKILMGQAAQAHLAGTSKMPLPPYSGRLRITRCIAGEMWTNPMQLELSTEHCGTLTAKAEKVRVYDYLGLMSLRVRHIEPITMTVYPRPLSMPGLNTPDRFLARSWRPKHGGGFSENHELRLYRPGDSLNQVHWKLTAKTGKLILREPMEPENRLVLVTMNLRGTTDALDRKFGRLLWLGNELLEKNIRFELHALTGDGIMTYPIATPDALDTALSALLGSSPADAGDVRTLSRRASWHCHIGGEPDET